jgi:hypothetical protein
MDESVAPARELKPSFLVAGWLLAALSVLLPLFAVPAIVIGVISIQRDREKHGIGIISLSVVATVLFFWLASQTLVPQR